MRSALVKAVAVAAVAAAVATTGADAARTGAVARAGAPNTALFKMLKGGDGLADNVANGVRKHGDKIFTPDEVAKAAKQLIPEGHIDDAAESVAKKLGGNAEAAAALMRQANDEIATINREILRLSGSSFPDPGMAYKSVISRIEAGKSMPDEILDVSRMLVSHSRTSEVLERVNSKLDFSRRALVLSKETKSQRELMRAIGRRVDEQNAVKLGGRTVPYKGETAYLSLVEQKGLKALLEKVESLPHGQLDSLTARELRVLRGAQDVVIHSTGEVSPVTRRLVESAGKAGDLKTWQAAFAKGGDDVKLPSGYTYVDDLGDAKAAAGKVDEVDEAKPLVSNKVDEAAEKADEVKPKPVEEVKPKPVDEVFETKYPKTRYDLDLVDEAVSSKELAKVRSDVMFSLGATRRTDDTGYKAARDLVHWLNLPTNANTKVVVDALNDVFLHGEKASNFNRKLVHRLRWLANIADDVPLQDPKWQQGFVNGLVMKTQGSEDRTILAGVKLREMAKEAAGEADALAKKKADDAAAAAKADELEVKNLGGAAVKVVKNIEKSRSRTKKLVAFASRNEEKGRYLHPASEAEQVAANAKAFDEGLALTRAQIDETAFAATAGKVGYQRPGTFVEIRPSPWSEELLQTLEKQAKDLEYLKTVNGGKLPKGVRGMSEAESETMESLRKYFNQDPKPIRDFDGYFYARWQTHVFAMVRKELLPGGGGIDLVLDRLLKKSQSAGDHFTYPLVDFLRKQVRHRDSPMEVALRRLLREHTEEISSRAAKIGARAEEFSANHGASQALEALANALREPVKIRPTFKELFPSGWAAQLRGTFPDQPLTREMFEDMARARAAASYVPNGGEVRERSAMLVNGAFENNGFLWRLFGRQWDEPVGAAATHVSDAPLRKKWGDAVEEGKKLSQ